MVSITGQEAERTLSMQAPIIPIVGDLVRSTPGTISLGQGVVYYGPPPEAVSALTRFFDDPANHRYGPVDGIPQLRAAVARKLEAENGITLAPDQRVVVTAGGNMAFLNAMLAIIDAGDEVILPLPYYFNQEMAITMAGGRVVTVPTDDDFQLDLSRLRAAITSRTRAIVTISPNNPTGAVYPEAALRAVNELCQEYGIYHISDEAYEYFLYDDARHFSPGSIAGSGAHTISLYSLSKAFGFASWRIGYMVIPAHLSVAIGKIQDTVLICPPVVSQFAAVGALEAGVGYAREHISIIGAARRAVLAKLAEISSFCTIVPTEGAFYLLLRIATEIDAMDLVERLIREHRVAVIPGTTFGLDGGCYLRLSYGALRPAEVEEGVGRLVRGLKEIVGSSATVANGASW